MQYLGGKSRLAKKIAPVLMAAWQPGMDYYEPFVGAGSVLVEMCKALPKEARKFASDIHPDLILMWRALQQGWVPPVNVSEEQYKMLKREAPSALRGFAGFGCAFGGDWFHGYARNKRGDNFAAQSSHSLMCKINAVVTAEFRCCDYRELLPYNALVYCDPPYANRAGYKDDFDHVAFWDTIRRWSVNNVVFVSEYSAPHDFKAVNEFSRNQELRTSGTVREPVVDCLFRLPV